jgi:hypothetical protein
MEVGKSNAFKCETVEIRRFDFAAETTEIRKAHIVDDDEQYVWPIRSGVRRYRFPALAHTGGQKKNDR